MLGVFGAETHVEALMGDPLQDVLAPAYEYLAHNVHKVLRGARLILKIRVDLAFDVEQDRLIGAALDEIKHFG